MIIIGKIVLGWFQSNLKKLDSLLYILNIMIDILNIAKQLILIN